MAFPEIALFTLNCQEIKIPHLIMKWDIFNEPD